MRGGMVALIGMVVALVFILIALVGPWYAASMFGADMDFGLFDERAEGIDSGPIDTTMYIAILAFIFVLIAVIGMLGINFNFGDPNMMGKIGGIFGILAFIFGIISAIYFMTLEEWEVFDGFWNEIGGPGYGWYLMLFGAIIALIFSIPLFKKQTA